MKVRIIVDNNRSRVVGSRKVVNMLHSTFKVRSPGAFYSPAFKNRTWDGFIKYVTDTGTFQTGHLEEVCKRLSDNQIKYKIQDGRDKFKDLHSITRLGGLDFRGYQADAVRTLLANRLLGLPYCRGILHEATNAGKNLIAAGIMASFSKKRRGLFLIDNKEIYEQAVRELEELLPGEIGQVRSGYTKWGRLTVCMVQTLSNLLKKDVKAKTILARADIVLVDECDTTANLKTGKHCISYCMEAPIRVGLSGTPLAHKDKTRNMNILGIFGPVVHKTTNKQLVDQGFSAKPNIRFVQGNVRHNDKSYEYMYRRGIVKSRERAKATWKIVAQAIKRDKLPCLILIKLHKHIEYLLKYCPESIMDAFNIETVHHRTPNRRDIFKRFHEEKIPILISSMIIRRGKNLPIMRSLVNAAGGTSEANALQVLGRGLRKIEGVKEELDFWDFWDNGPHLNMHSKRRVRYYKAQGFPVEVNL